MSKRHSSDLTTDRGIKTDNGRGAGIYGLGQEDIRGEARALADAAIAHIDATPQFIGGLSDAAQLERLKPNADPRVVIENEDRDSAKETGGAPGAPEQKPEGLKRKSP